MKKVLIKGFLVMAYFVFLLGFTSSVQAESLPPGFLVGDETGFNAGTDGQYFIVNNNIEPGKTFTREISISNYSNNGDAFSINLVMNPEDDTRKPTIKGTINLLEAINVKLNYQGKIIYQGPMNGKGSPVANKKSNPINLGTFETGEVRTIHAEFTVSNEYPDESWKNVNSTDFYWLFYASKSKDETPPSTTPSSSTKKPMGILPSTGEEVVNALLLLLSILMLIGMTLLYKVKRKN